MGRKPKLRRLDRRLYDAAAAPSQLLGKLDNQDRVFRREPNQHHQTDLHIDVVLPPAQRDKGQRAQHRHRHREQDDERQRKALILRRERQVHNQDSECEDDDRLAARLNLFKRQPGPAIAHALQHVLLRQTSPLPPGPGSNLLRARVRHRFPPNETGCNG